MDLKTPPAEPRVPFILRPMSAAPATDDFVPAEVKENQKPVENITPEKQYYEEQGACSDLSSSPDRPKPVAYTVDFMDTAVSEQEAAAMVPERLRQRRTSGPHTAEQIAEKMKQAEERKKVNNMII